MTISNKIIKKLYANSGNICAYPGCNVNLIENINQSQICHIISEKQNGPRHIENYNNGDYDVEENLILLCLNHHKLIDTNVSEYPIEVLRNMKKQHEKYVEKMMKANDINNIFISKVLELLIQYEINSLEYIDFCSIFDLKIIENMQYCSMDLKDIVNKSCFITVEKDILKKCCELMNLLNNIVEYLVDKSETTLDFKCIPDINKIDKSYLYNMRKTILTIYNNLRF